MAKREEGRAESVRTRRRICIGTAGMARRRFTMAAWRSMARSREARMAGVEVEMGMPPYVLRCYMAIPSAHAGR
eukprot:scaffold78732_cov33-Phaeocystis_antarctica.AAC.1